jgi:hypothetical protein
LDCRPGGDHGSGVVYRPFYPAPDTVICGVLIRNVVHVTAMFALIAYAQIMKEI